MISDCFLCQNHLDILEETDIKQFECLLNGREYQQIEDSYCFITNPMDCDKFKHYLMHQPIERIKELFHDRFTTDNIEFRKVKSDAGHRANEGVLIFLLRFVAAKVYRINLDNVDTIKFYAEFSKRNFNQSELPLDAFNYLKRKYLTDNSFPAFIIERTDLTVQFVDLININEETLTDITGNHCDILSRWYELVGSFKSYTCNELKEYVSTLKKDSVMWITLNFVIAKFHDINITDKWNFDCVTIVNELTGLKQQSHNDYYGTHIISDEYPWLPYLLVALCQDGINYPLIAFNKNSEHHRNVYESIGDAGSYTRGYTTICGKLKIPEKILLGINRYLWIGGDIGFEKYWTLFYPHHPEFPARNNEWSCYQIKV